MQKEENPKKGWRWWFFNRFGPKEVQGLVNYIDQMRKQYETDSIMIYPGGEYGFHIHMMDENDDSEPIFFHTLQERNAFAMGFQTALPIQAESAHDLSAEELEALKIMDKKSTHGGSGGSTH